MAAFDTQRAAPLSLFRQDWLANASLFCVRHSVLFCAHGLARLSIARSEPPTSLAGPDDGNRAYGPVAADPRPANYPNIFALPWSTANPTRRGDSCRHAGRPTNQPVGTTARRTRDVGQRR